MPAFVVWRTSCRRPWQSSFREAEERPPAQHHAASKTADSRKAQQVSWGWGASLISAFRQPERPARAGGTRHRLRQRSAPSSQV